MRINLQSGHKSRQSFLKCGISAKVRDNMAKECTPKMLYRLVKERALAGDNIDQFCAFMVREGYELPTSSADKPLVYWRGQYNALRKVAMAGEKNARASGNIAAIDAAVKACRLTKLMDKPKGKSGKTGGKLAEFADMFADDMDEFEEEQEEQEEQNEEQKQQQTEELCNSFPE